MAKIAEYLKQILSARYGRDVRQSIHDAISAINDESTECWATVEKVPETLAIAAVKDRVSGKDVTLPMSSDFVATDFNASGNTEQDTTSGKNLLDCSGLTEQTIYGVTFTPKYSETEEDVKKGYPLGSLMYINANGMATERANYNLNTAFSLSAGRYWLNGVTGGSNSTYVIFIANYTVSSNGDQVFTLTEDKTNLHAFIAVYAGTTLNNVKFYPMIRLATITDSTYEPFTNGASPNPDYPQEIKSVVISKIKTCRKNIAVSDGVSFDNHNNSGISGIKNEDGTFALSGTSTKAQSVRIASARFKANTTYTLSGCPSGGGQGKYYLYLGNNASIKDFGNGVTFSFTEDKEDSLWFIVSAGVSLDGLVIKPMVEEGTTATDYEPYTESVATLSNPITLNGLNGVQDYVDVKRGVLVQKFKEIVLNGSEGWSFVSDNSIPYFHTLCENFGFKNHSTLNYMCDFFRAIVVNDRYQENTMFLNDTGRAIFTTSSFATVADWKAHLSSNPITVVYELKTPIETPLPEADVEALKNIRTFKGTTHVFTDSEVKPDLEVEYVIDTKLYIDAKIAELQ